MISDLLQKLTEAVLELVAAALGNVERRVLVRRLTRLLLAALSVWMLVLSLRSWPQTADGIAGVWALVAEGRYQWTVMVPLLAIGTILVLFWNRPGTCQLLFELWFLWLLASVVVAAFVHPNSDVVPNVYATVLVVMVVYGIIAWALAIGDVVPLTSRLAWLAYPCNFRQFRRLYRLADRWGWTATGPEGTQHTVSVYGSWYGHQLHIQNSAEYKVSRSEFAAYSLKVNVHSETPLWPLLVQVGPNAPEPPNANKSLRGSCRDAKRRAVAFYLWPDGPITESSYYALLRVLLDGSPYLRDSAVISTSAEGVLYQRRSQTLINESIESLEQLLQFLSQLAWTMVGEGMCGPPERRV